MIIVTGMHRSGTSFVCQLMTALGIDFGDPQLFYASDGWNTRGYFEVRPIIDTNSGLITGLPRTAGRLTAFLSKLIYLSMPSRQRITRREARYRSRMEELGTRFKAVKDPRFCLTLNSWVKTVDVERVVICLREPRDTAQSLRKRERVPTSVAYRFWRYHMQSLLDVLPVRKSAFVQFDQLCGPNAVNELQLLARFLGIDTSDVQLRHILQETFAPKLVHVAGTRSLPADARVDTLWSQLLDLATIRESEVLDGRVVGQIR